MPKGKNPVIKKISAESSRIYAKLKRQTGSKGSRTLYKKAQKKAANKYKNGKL